MGKKVVSSKPFRVVLDTNIVLSALIFSHGKLSWIRQAWQNNVFIPIVSTGTVKELIRVLNYPKFKLEAHEQEILLGDYLPFCETIQMPKILPDVPACRDPLDAMFLILAMASRADGIITGDHDLLSLKKCHDILIMNTQEGRHWLAL